MSRLVYGRAASLQGFLAGLLLANQPAADSSPRAILAPTVGSLKLSVPTATSLAPTSSRSRACDALLTPPMPITGTCTRSATAATCASATARIAGPDRPPVPPPSHGPGVSVTDGLLRDTGSRASARNVLISDTAFAPPASAACAQAATSAALGVSFTISGLSVCGRIA